MLGPHPLNIDELSVACSMNVPVAANNAQRMSEPHCAAAPFIRPGTPADIEAVAGLHRAVRRACLPYLPDLHTADEDLRFFRERVFPTWAIWVDGGDRLLGYCAFRYGWLDHLYVDPMAQGQGLGSALLNQATVGQSQVRLWVFQRNAPAIRFYTRRGFRLVELTDGSGNEEHEPDALYEWRR